MLLTYFLKESIKNYPEQIAVKDDKRQLSFEELDRLSNRVAGWLLSQGCSPGDRIGIHLGRSAEGIISIFGILKASCVYVPIDITLPPQRKEHIIKDCGIKTLITDSRKLRLLDSILEKQVDLDHLLILDSAFESKGDYYKSAKLVFLNKIDKFEKVELPLLDENNLANILYTSGSTGLPKGVMISRKSLAECIKNEADYFNIGKTDITASTTPLHFSMSPFEIFTSIKCGATLCIVPPGIFSFPRSLAAFIEREKITIWHSVPSVITYLMLYGNVEGKDFSRLRLVHLAGGPVPVEQIRKFMQLFPHLECYNVYGSAETYEIARYNINKLGKSAKSVPVGEPWKGVEMFLTDDDGKLVPKKEGAEGELYVKTPSMMEGYWNDEEKTREVLIDSPFHSSSKKIKLYKTKDLLKVDKNGEYVLTGRADTTIKRDGFRIGLTEIESVLSNHPRIEEAAAVVDREDKRKLIKAVIVLSKGSNLSKKEIREFCRDRLPRYMIPDKIELRKSLPKTSTGKIDKKSIK